MKATQAVLLSLCYSIHNGCVTTMDRLDRTRIRIKSGTGLWSSVGTETELKTGIRIENRMGIEIDIDGFKRKKNSSSMLVQLRELTIRARHLQENADQRLPGQQILNKMILLVLIEKKNTI
ncbi:hypothetical protein EVAR_63800_1 [Eumeta japonica]|uniref:Uncharacterized protein n=1 Tax=Eumeta variegata TaxID=151549 RepID=A0A4C1ZRP2_EUMVA|nr:hypothetical protein EVAR_63800_1 [Eumeta japonica]